MIRSVFIANRGEIAVRIIRTCKEMGIRTVVACSEADRTSLAVRMADEAVCVGPPPASESYLNQSNLIAAAVLKGCDAVHPGFGFLSERADFARRVREEGLVFIGPSPEVIHLLGDKVQAKETARKYGVPVIPGSDGAVEDVAQARALVREMGFPVIVKAAAGGGGKGMRIVWKEEDLERTLRIASQEAEKAFSDGTLYIEKFLQNPRHVEVQLLGDAHGNVVHLGERDCSVQKNHQKLVEESPSPVVTPEMRKAMGEAAVRLFKGIGYVGAGTVEFLVADGRFYFMEVNARIQVEHPVTEMITGVDIVREQIRAAGGERLSLTQDEVRLDGYALECRINALSPGKVTAFHAPAGFKTRIDSYLYTGAEVPAFYDSLVAKVIVGASTREEGIARMLRALDELVVEGITVNTDLQKRIVSHPIFRSGRFGTDVLEKILEEGGQE
ncbi:acetyl-CoA carboxylase, biotin carboxylase [Spirochaeta thermophila DSM 6578]|uniref:biotin carboxylase n=1 Tax=Winmispira thermophila (strain ATCC 700085 / DSM 6578 / Z-1203) TaxID=869211 RepID=G0GFG6_WINT7|nr:acetyl-CoA carboxylase biotin carboxylase subunit [Spirochaeta thermophila]AEJ61580.1 acetyl-CoA carboxylase, biotin carboxylase [Spirochaeta thermophila DSM 6578]